MGRRKSQGRKNPPQIKIYSEGHTEKIYFDALRDYIGIKENLKYSAKQINKQGLDLYYKVHQIYQNHDFDSSPVKIVLVVDKDYTDTSNLKKLEQKCKESGYILVFSNMCFELWLLLHFQPVTKSLDAKELCNALSVKLSKKYKKTDKPTITSISKLYKQALLNSDSMDSIVNTFEINPYTNINKFLKSFFDI